MNRISGMLVLVGVALAAATGCAGADSAADEDAPEQEATTEAQGLVTSTSIVVDENGETKTVRVEHLTPAEMQRQIDERAAMLSARKGASHDGVGTATQAITLDGSCAGASLWLYDQPFSNGTNPGNRLCISGPSTGGDGAAVYGSVCRLFAPRPLRCATWAGAVRAFWPGTDEGYFSNTTNACDGLYGVELFGPYTEQGQTNATACGRSSSAVYFGPFIF